MCDVLIVGGGAIGLSIAWELAEQQLSVHLVDRQKTGQEASWAGAGMVPPGEVHIQEPQYRQLCQLTAARWPELAAHLKESTQVDVEYHRCGAIIYQPVDQSADQFQQEIAAWHLQGIKAERISSQELARLEPALPPQTQLAYHLPEQGQVRNPRYLQALRQACINAGVKISEATEVEQIQSSSRRLTGLVTSAGVFSAERYLWATGSWSGQFSNPLQWSVPVEPVRGQIAQFQTSGQLSHIIEQGKRYLVPRLDGLLLVGSTEERVDFDRQPSQEKIQELQQFASQFLPELSAASPVKNWCGFRPMSSDQLPILGQLPNWDNVYVATGHYRAGLALSPVSAILMRQLLLGQELLAPIDAFSPDRFRTETSQTV